MSRLEHLRHSEHWWPLSAHKKLAWKIEVACRAHANSSSWEGKALELPRILENEADGWGVYWRQWTCFGFVVWEYDMCPLVRGGLLMFGLHHSTCTSWSRFAPCCSIGGLAWLRLCACSSARDPDVCIIFSRWIDCCLVGWGGVGSKCKRGVKEIMHQLQQILESCEKDEQTEKSHTNLVHTLGNLVPKWSRFYSSWGIWIWEERCLETCSRETGILCSICDTSEG